MLKTVPVGAGQLRILRITAIKLRREASQFKGARASARMPEPSPDTPSQGWQTPLNKAPLQVFAGGDR